MRVTSFGFCLSVIVNEKPLNLEKTTYNGVSVLLIINGYESIFFKHENELTNFFRPRFFIEINLFPLSILFRYLTHLGLNSIL